MKCCPNADARKITREEHEDARQVARDIAKTKQYAISLRLAATAKSVDGRTLIPLTDHFHVCLS